MKHLRIALTQYTYNISFCFTSIISNASPKLIVRENTYSHTFHISNSKIVVYQRNLKKTANIEQHQTTALKYRFFTQFEIFSRTSGSKESHINLKSEIVNLKWVNLKYKTGRFIWRKRKLHWCHFVLQYTQWSVEKISLVKRCKW